MHIVHIASELTPIAKVGGLGDVVYGLSKELIKQGATVQIILPKYDSIHYNLLKNLKVYYRDLWSYEGPYRYNNTIWSAEVEGLSVLLIEPHHPKYFFGRGTIYGCEDDMDRFLYFARAAMEFLFKSESRPDIIHLHDWQAAVCSVLYKDMYLDLGFHVTRFVFTIHNLEYQGKCSPRNLTQIGLRGEDYLLASRLQDPLESHLINLLKGGILYADAVTTVSPTYKKEILTEEEGKGLHSVLLQKETKITGILNGIDEDFWNPEIDGYLAHKFPAHPPFTKEKWSSIEEGKAANKERLRSLLGLEKTKAPLVACITRLVPQKGPVLIAHAFSHIIAKGAQCVILGSAYTEDIRELFAFLKSTCSGQGAIILDYNEELSHVIYAGSDMLMVPSLFEPCGLTQMIAFRYGSVPIVRKTGGLRDTVFDIDNDSCPIAERNGFVFKKPEKKEFCETIDRALQCFEKDPKGWNELMKQGMKQDFSWKKAAKEYLSLYEKLQKT